jgi:corrinoid protein of di/trimethylamine methyltransferase
MPDTKELYTKMEKTVLDGDIDAAAELADEALSKGMDPLEVINEGYLIGLQKVGDLWEKGELFLPEMIQGAEAMKAAVAKLQPALLAKKETRKILGKVVIGTVHGDIHEIGKSIVGTMLSANGFEVVDLGADVPNEDFINKAKEIDADIIGLSALLTTTMPEQKTIIELIKKEGLANKIKVVIGGAPVSQSWSDEIGASGYAEDAVAAVSLCKSLMGA